MRKSKVAGVAGAVRIQPLTFAELAKQELHGKRLDTTSMARRINEVPPVTSTGLDLRALYDAHVEGAFVPKAHTKVMQVLIQFPKDLVDLDDADGLLWHAKEFGKRIWGDEAIFADRYDLDEKSKGVVDLFVAPRYIKTTKRNREGRPAISMTRHNKLLAEKHGRDPTKVWDVGKSLQDELHEYLRDVMSLEGVERGSPKLFAGSDWKSAEQLREEELATMKLELETQGAAVEAAVTAIPQWKEKAEEAGREAGFEVGVDEGRAKVAEEEAAARQARDAAVQVEQAAQMARDAADEAHRLAAEDRRAARQEKEDARAEGKREGLAAASHELLSREAQVVEEERRLGALAAGLNDREKAAVENELASNALLADLGQRDRKAKALEAGMEAFAVGDLIAATTNAAGARILEYKDRDARERWHERILPAFREVWRFVTEALARLAKREKERAAELDKREAALASAEAGRAAIEGFLAGDLKATMAADGAKTFTFTSAEADKRWREKIRGAGIKAWDFVRRAGEESEAVERLAAKLEKLIEPINEVRTDYEAASELARQAMSLNPVTAAALASVNNPMVQEAEAALASQRHFRASRPGAGR